VRLGHNLKGELIVFLISFSRDVILIDQARANCHVNKKLSDKGKQKIDEKDLSGRRIYRRILM